MSIILILTIKMLKILLKQTFRSYKTSQPKVFNLCQSKKPKLILRNEFFSKPTKLRD